MSDFRFHMTRVSGNKKTGPIPVTTSSENTCPVTCPLYGAGCYAKSGPLALHWRKVSDSEEKRSMDSESFLEAIAGLPRGQLWRHNQAGDMPHKDGNIDAVFARQIVKANKGKKGFTYTHHKLNSHNITMIGKMNDKGFTVNHSADTVQGAVSIFKGWRQHMPVVTLLPIDAPNVQTVEGVKVVACPAEKSTKVNCANCGLCADKERDYIIGFRAHGTQKKKAEVIARG